jgi:alkylation response protein AidB-like acyl-CoA dehydrogenase
VDVSLTAGQEQARTAGRAVAAALTPATAAGQVISAAAAAGVLLPDDLAAAVLAIDAMAWEHPPHAMTLAVQTAVARAVPGDSRLRTGSVSACMALSSDGLPVVTGGRVSGRASWVGPAPDAAAIAIVGARDGDHLTACVVAMDAPGVQVEAIATAGMTGFSCGHVSLDAVPCVALGSPRPVMAVARLLLSAAGLGMGRRALSEALAAARLLSRTGAGGEQTVQGLLSDAATELDAARLLILKAACAGTVSLAEASMAKLAVTEATQRAVTRATQVVGAETFHAGHVIERLAQDVRALELFAGRTEALREAVADEILPQATA